MDRLVPLLSLSQSIGTTPYATWSPPGVSYDGFKVSEDEDDAVVDRAKSSREGCIFLWNPIAEVTFRINFIITSHQFQIFSVKNIEIGRTLALRTDI